ncbi:zinc finger BED domain-containing protein RICESLEEPER 1-like protein [Cinnamomum micranthum f. kanehirae]|uniref:Zinc finger BED domain-containing protein RICESLEEPER 1-like protein n=1 Tax=Cinnamomum micranthum f. kanehirae TaxID=337451 RepID=A0A443N393_9MAGN|nr:zinc finger BED domain-containing protein RICESLEEPER 1-like protein [Cinnamomum micranthum f. kanehirae]
MSSSLEESLSNMARKMKVKFEKYWGRIKKVNMMLVVAVVLDPRLKLDYVKFSYSEILTSDATKELTKKVRDALNRLYIEYQKFESESFTSSLESFVDDVDGCSSSATTNTIVSTTSHISKFRKYLNEVVSNEGKSEVDKYLEETVEKIDPNTSFDILNWWKVNPPRYGVLSQAAQDVLAILVSTVASKFAFSSRGLVLDQFRSSLIPKLVEALICTQDWLRDSAVSIDVEDNMDEIEAIEFEGFGDFGRNRPSFLAIDKSLKKNNRSRHERTSTVSEVGLVQNTKVQGALCKTSKVQVVRHLCLYKDQGLVCNLERRVDRGEGNTTVLKMMRRGRKRAYQGRGRMSPYQSNVQYEQYHQAQQEQYLQFPEYQKKMSQRAIEGSSKIEPREAGLSEANPPQKIIRTDESREGEWIQVKRKEPHPPIESYTPPRIISNIDEPLYPPRYRPEEYNSRNMIGGVFLRNCPFQEQFPIGIIRKEFNRAELLIVDNIWKAVNDNHIIELKQAVISALRIMRRDRILIAQKEFQVNQYGKELINSTGIISCSETARVAEDYTYKKHSFMVALNISRPHEDIDTLSVYDSAAELMSQKTSINAEDGMDLIGSPMQPVLWFNEKAKFEIIEEHKKVLFNTGFVRFADIYEEKSLNFLPQEIAKILKRIIKIYPYSLETYVLAPMNFALIRIHPNIQKLKVIHHDHIKVSENYTRIDILKQRAINIEAISHQLKECGIKYYTLYCNTLVVIQAAEVIGTGTVERVKEGHAPLQIINLPCSLAEVTALGIADSLISKIAEEIAPSLLMDPETGSKLVRQASSMTYKSKIDASRCSAGPEEQTKTP